MFKFKKKENKKDQNMVLFFFKMVVLFFLIAVVIVDQILVSGSYYSIATSKYGKEFLAEGLRAVFILIVLLLFGNSYIFKEKREKFVDSIFLGWPILAIAVFYLLQSIFMIQGQAIDINALLNLMSFCFLIGVFEEFLCRGWLQNEFIERFKKNKQQVIQSIVCASLVFGVMHISNFWTSNQGFFITLMQILQATAVGVLFGSIYYKTKNIWGVVFLHAFYDFSIMLGSLNMVRDCQTGTLHGGIMVYEIITSILIVALYIVSSILVFRSSVGTREKIKTEKEQKNRKLFITAVVLLILVLLPVPIEGAEEAQVCYSYKEKKINGFYQIVEVTSSKIYYELENDFILAEEEDSPGIIFIKDKEGHSVQFDYPISDVYVLEENNEYEIVMIENLVQASTAHYFKINKNEMAHSDEYLNTVKESVRHYDLPVITSGGYIENKETNKKYLYLRGQYTNQFLISDNDKIYLIKE